MGALIYRMRLRRADRIHQRAGRAYKRGLSESGAMSVMFRKMSSRLYKKAATVKSRARAMRVAK